MSGLAFLKPSYWRQVPPGWLYLLNGCAATAFWVYYLSGGFESSGLIDAFYEIQSLSLGRGGLSITPGPSDLFYHDICIYRGSYYFYWGLLPSLFYMCFSTILGSTAAHYLCVSVFLFSFAFFYQRIIALVFDCAAADAGREPAVVRVAPIPLLWLFLFSLPFNDSSNWFYGRFVIYEQAIVFGLAFAVPAVYFTMRCMIERRSSYACFAALLMTLAAHTRALWLPMACLSIFLAIYVSIKFRETNPSGLTVAAERVCVICSILLLVGLLALNYARFDSLWDFGLAHQNSQVYMYQRGIVRLFSLETRWWTFVTNILLYYAPISYVESFGLFEKSASLCETTPPSFLASAPQFLLLAVLTPLAVFKMRRTKKGLIIPFVVVGFAALYINFLVAAFGTMVITRYFVECYFFVIVLLFIVVLSLCPRMYGVIVMIVCLGIYIPSNAALFAKVTPELRLVDSTSDAGKVFFVERNASWLHGSVSTEHSARFRRYNLIGVAPAAKGMLVAEDVASVYMIPQSEQTASGESAGCVEFKGLTALALDGSLGVLIDGKQIGRIALRKGVSVNSELCFKHALRGKGPVQVVTVFFPGSEKHLPPRPLCSPCFVFRELIMRGSF